MLFKEVIEINVIHECMSNYRHEIREAPFTPCTRLDIHQEQVGNQCDPNLCANGIPTIAKEIAQLEVLLQLLVMHFYLPTMRVYYAISAASLSKSLVKSLMESFVPLSW